MFGQRLRHIRRSRGLTLAELGEQVGRAPSVLSLLENGRREPKLSLIEALAAALSVSAGELMRNQPPSRRAQLELSLAEAQRDPVYADLGLPPLRVGARVPSDVLEHLVALHAELRRQRTRPTATPEEARAANADLRLMMGERGNYFAEIEKAAAEALAPVGYTGGALSQGMLLSVVSHHGFSVRYVQDLPRSARSVTDLRNRRIYLRQESLGHAHAARGAAADARALRARPLDAGRLRRLPAAAGRGQLLRRGRARARAGGRDSSCARPRTPGTSRWRTCATCSRCRTRWPRTGSPTWRPTTSALPCHFVKNDEGGIIYKAYENDGVVFPADPTGAIEGQRMCRYWSGRQVFTAADRFSPYFQYSDTPSGTYWCTALVDSGRERGFAVTLGVRYEDSRWFRGRDTTIRTTSGCPAGRVLPAAAGRAGGALGGHGVAVGAGALARAAGAAVGQLSRRRRVGRVRVPGPARGYLAALAASGSRDRGYERSGRSVGRHDPDREDHEERAGQADVDGE